MKRSIVYLTVFCTLLCFLVSCSSLSDPYMTEEQRAQYREFYPNVIWEECGVVLQRASGVVLEGHHYYGIKGVPTDAFIARVTQRAMIGEVSYSPAVMIHKDQNAKLLLDPSAAKLTMRTGMSGKQEEHRMALGKYCRTGVLCEVEQSVAAELAALLMGSDTEYLTDKAVYERYGFHPDTLCTADGRSTLYVEFCLAEYPSLLWVGQIKRAADGYVVEVLTPIGESKYLPCGDALCELIDLVTEEHDLITKHDKSIHYVDHFSYAEHLEAYPAGTPGVKYEGFINTDEYDVLYESQALERAKSECTVEWDTSHIAFDRKARIWLVEFSKADVDGGCQSVYLTEKGITVLIVYGE